MYMLRLFIFASLISVTICSCTVSQNMQYKGFENFSVSNLGAEPKIMVDVNLHNPNKMGATIREMEFTVLVNDKPIGSAGIDDKVKVKGNRDFTVPIAVNTSLDKMGGILSAGFNSFIGNSDVPVGLTGTFTVQKYYFFRKTFTFEFNDKLNVSKLIKN